MLAFCAIVIVVAKRWDKPSYFDWTIGHLFCPDLPVIARLAGFCRQGFVSGIR
jgi:hypothetical protein